MTSVLAQIIYVGLLLAYVVGGAFIADGFVREIERRDYDRGSIHWRIAVGGAFLAVVVWPLGLLVALIKRFVKSEAK